MVINIPRLIRHLLSPPWRVKRAFPARTMRVIETTIRETEANHQGQIRFAVETSLELSALLRNETAAERAIEVFSHLRVWDTEQNNGVLIYLLLADHDVEIVADRGIHAHVGQEGWEKICHAMEAAFRQGKFEKGVLAGVCAVSNHLVRHFPGEGERMNELPDVPVVL